MGCPFVHLASFASGSKTNHHHHHEQEGQADGPMSLSKALREGTAASHRQVEKSKGVGMLLHSVSTGSAQGDDPLHFDRKDYVRWLIMLTSIYITLEAGLQQARASDAALQAHSTIPLLQPLLDSGLPAVLGRTHTLLLDIAAHLATLESHLGTLLDDLVQETRDVYIVDSAEGIDREDAAARSDLAHLVLALQPDALAATRCATASAVQLTRKHIDLLTPAQVHATRSYVRHLVGLSDADSRSNKIGLILSHAYTRYLGDLSGGQHILKKVAKRWPCDADVSASFGDGFEFYCFEADVAAAATAPPSTDAGDRTTPAVAKDLKTTFRENMDGGLEVYVLRAGPGSRDRALTSLVTEANVSFEQNAALFEALLPAQHRMTLEDREATMDAQHHTKIVALPPSPSLAAKLQYLMFTKGQSKNGTTIGVLALSLVSAVAIAWSNSYA